MTDERHFRALERMYLAGPINEIFRPEIRVSKGEARIEIRLSEQYHHAGGAVHGSVYFKMLDDAAFFAANSLEPEFFVLTTTFTTYLTRPVSQGILVSQGRVVSQTKSQFIAESVVYDDQGRDIGRGNGIFVRSRKALTDAMGYGEATRDQSGKTG